MRLSDVELKNVIGGASDNISTLILVLIGIGTLVVGMIDGYLSKIKCKVSL